MNLTEEQYHYHLQQLRDSGRFVFAYKITFEERNLPLDQQRSRVMLHAQRCVDSYFDNMPKYESNN
jgi:hypothetical protein